MGLQFAKEIELEDPYENMGAKLSARSCYKNERNRW